MSEKFSYAKVPFPTIDQIGREMELNLLKSGWESMLRHQLPELSPVEEYIEKLRKALVQLFPSEVGTTS